MVTVDQLREIRAARRIQSGRVDFRRDLRKRYVILSTKMIELEENNDDDDDQHTCATLIYLSSDLRRRQIAVFVEILLVMVRSLLSSLLLLVQLIANVTNLLIGRRVSSRSVKSHQTSRLDKGEQQRKH